MIPSIKLLHDRCERVGDCMLWQQATNGNGTPIISLSKDQRSRPVRPIAYRLIFGAIPPGLFVYVTCGDQRCISGRCMKSGTKSAYMRNASLFGAYSNPTRDAQRARIAQARSSLDWTAVHKIRADRADGRLLREIAAEHDISMDVVSKIARGLIWREHSKNASVFHQAA